MKKLVNKQNNSYYYNKHQNFKKKEKEDVDKRTDD